MKGRIFLVVGVLSVTAAAGQLVAGVPGSTQATQIDYDFSANAIAPIDSSGSPAFPYGETYTGAPCVHLSRGCDCFDTYCGKPLPDLFCVPGGGKPNDYCSKQLPPIRCLPKFGHPDDYCRKPFNLRCDPGFPHKKNSFFLGW